MAAAQGGVYSTPVLKSDCYFARKNTVNSTATGPVCLTLLSGAPLIRMSYPNKPGHSRLSRFVTQRRKNDLMPCFFLSFARHHLYVHTLTILKLFRFQISFFPRSSLFIFFKF